MKRNLTMCMLFVAAIPGLVHAGGAALQVRDLADATGLSERQVQMVIGAHTAYPEYLTQYDWAKRKFVRALGKERYEELMAGREIVLDNGQRLAIVAD